MMNYDEAMEFIENTGKFSINLGLQRVERLCELMGNPEKKLKIIHIAGTNGKGSTTTFVSSILMEQGYRVGIYTSPYIERFTERIRINNDEISRDDIAGLVSELEPLIDKVVGEGLDHPTEFEIITACALKYFEESKVDYVVLEVGLGGRFDATNVIDPLLSVITTISMDHVNILGDTLSKIAFEKAGIIKEGIPVVVYPQEKEAMDVILDVAESRNSRICKVEDLSYEIVSNTIDGVVYNTTGIMEYENIKLNMLGDYQVLNSLTALRCVEVLRGLGVEIEDRAIYKGLEEARWPGRFEVLRRNPFIVLDGGHNEQGIDALVKSCKRYFDGKNINIVCGMLRDKNYKDMVGKLASIGSKFITVEPNNPRAMTPGELKEVVEGFGREAAEAKNIREAVELGLKITSKDEVLVFCGSLYMIGEARTILMEQ